MYYKKTIEEIYKELNSSKEGLTGVQADFLLKEQGFNELQTDSKINPLKIFFSQFADFITYILLFAAIISLLSGYLHDKEGYIDAIIIFAILMLNAIIGFFQEYSAQKSLEALKKLNTVKAKVYRNKNLIEVDSKYLVVGDIIHLEAGDKVPADLRIFDEKKLRVEEASLTGESVPVTKHSSIIDKDVQLGDQKNMLFAGTSIAEGTAKAIVVKTAMNTEIGKITNLIKSAEEEMTPLQKKLDKFGKQLGIGVIVICLFIFFILSLKKGFNFDNMIVFGLIAISLAVAAVPTALPAVVTVALSVGVKKLLRRKALVRKLSSVETLGSCDIICTDKTGTLTKNEMTVKNAWTIDSFAEISGVGYNPTGAIEGKINPLLFKIGLACNNASLRKEKNIWTITGDPTEAALIVSAKKANINSDFEILDEIPFDSNRKAMSVLIKEKNETSYTMYSKGSTTSILNACTHVLINNKEVKITSEHKKQIIAQMNNYSSQALRVLSFGYKNISHKKDFVEDNLVFVGLQAMIDPPRPDVIESIKKCKTAGIRVIMITGDYKETAKAIGNEIGIVGDILTGEDLDKIDDDELGKALSDNTNIFARVIPEHKQRIVKILQSQGHIVAMTGDGVNDAPALKKANIGVAVGSGTDVAKEAADFVLLDDSFSNIVNAIEEGRGIYDNIQKSIMLLLSGNLGEVLIIFLAVLLDFNLPLTAILLLWINMITDGAPALAYSVDPYSKNIMGRKPNRNTNILPKDKLFLIGYLGIIGTMVGLSIFKFYGGNIGDSASVLSQTMVFNFIVMYELLLVFIIRKQYGIEQFSNLWLWFAVMFSLFLQFVIMYTPLSSIFKVVPLSLYDYLTLAYGGFLFILAYAIYYHAVLAKQDLENNLKYRNMKKKVKARLFGIV